MNGLLVFLGGGVGAFTRYTLGLFISHHAHGSNFPYHTLTINLLGAFLIGAIMEIFALRTQLPESMQLLLVTGFLGGFTTFSSFSLECSLMLERSDYLPGLIYILSSVMGTIALVFAGAWAARTVM